MDEFKWAWVLFVAASVAVLVRVALWFLPAPAVRHADRVTRAAGAGRGGGGGPAEDSRGRKGRCRPGPEAALEDLA